MTEIEQLAPAASVLGLTGQVLVCAKSPAFAPVTPIELIVIAAEPVLVKVTVCGGLVVPMVREPKPRLDGLNDALGAWLGALNRSRMFEVTLRPMVLATLWSQLQKPVLKPLSTANDHWIVPAEKTVAPLGAV